MSGMKGWLTFGAWRRPSVDFVSIDAMVGFWGIGILRRSDVRGVDADMMLLGRDSTALRRSQFGTQE